MKSSASRLKFFDLGSMSDCTPQAIVIRAAERISPDFKQWFPIERFRDLKVSVENMVSIQDLMNLWKLLAGRVQQGGVDNPSNAQINSTSPWTSDFTGRVSIL